MKISGVQTMEIGHSSDEDLVIREFDNGKLNKKFK